MNDSGPPTLMVAAAASAVATAVWVLLSWRTPTSTFHFAPFVAAAVGPYVASSTAGPSRLGDAKRVVIVSAAVVAAGIAVLVSADRLRGPTFWSDGGAPLEAVLFAIAGALTGLAIFSRRKKRSE